MDLKVTWNAFALQIALYCILVSESTQYPQTDVLPRVQQESNKTLYELSIKLPDNNFRDEIGSLQASGSSDEQLSVSGLIQINFMNPNAMANWIYNADKNGFRVRYSYKQLNGPIYHLIES
ncbi:uncharacterized protein LOC119687470 [Teleopsis dalmanni]|uniref:uncharacterized protein LOC119687470 n=1 Tax=Teleopsis dalmanni TaxID=139649 RepID=UPI0018CEB231|nr:uncharacterized protein LOC119687470 [Teleopsis dalmanni]